jgi:hypothetical protein
LAITPVIWKLLPNTAADGGLVDDLFLRAFVAGARALAGLVFRHPLLLDEHDGHRPAEVLAGGLEHLRRAARVERDHDRGLALLEAGTGVRQLLTRDDRLALEQHGTAVARVIKPRAERRALGAFCQCCVVLLVDQPELEGGRRTEDAQGFVRVGHAGQLHDDAVEPLAGDDRLRNAEFVDAIAQRRDVLLDREVLALLDLGRAQLDSDGAALTEHIGVDGQVRVLLAQQVRDLLRIVAAAKSDLNRVDAVAGHARERDALLAQHRAVVALHAREQLLDRALRVDFVHEVNAATQVEAEAHRFQSQRAHPARRARHVGQRHQVLRARVLLQDLARLQARGHVIEAQDQAVALEVRVFDRHALRLQRRDDLLALNVGDGGAVIARELQRGRLAEHVRQREQQRQEQDDGNQPDFPGRVVMHARTPDRLLRRSSGCPWAARW